MCSVKTMIEHIVRPNLEGRRRMAYPAVLTEARRLRKLGLACAGIVIGCKPNGSKDIRFHTGWQNTSVYNSTESIAEVFLFISKVTIST